MEKKAGRSIGADGLDELKPGTSMRFKAGWRQPMSDVVVLTEPEKDHVYVRELPTEKNPNPSIDSFKAGPNELFK